MGKYEETSLKFVEITDNLLSRKTLLVNATWKCLMENVKTPVLLVDYSARSLFQIRTDPIFGCQDNIKLTIFQIPHSIHGIANVSIQLMENLQTDKDISLPEIHGNLSLKEDSWSATVHLSTLEHGNITLSVPLFTSVSISSTAPSVEYSISMVLKREFFFRRTLVPVRPLPFVYTSDTTGYVTSSRFKRISAPYRGEFILNISNDKSVFITFPYFIPGLYSPVFYRYCNFEAHLQLTALGTGKSWTFCMGVLTPMVIRSSVKIQAYKHIPFKIMFAIIPKVNEPKLVSKGLYNCTVPQFSLFKSQIQCNAMVECFGKEDEKDCDYQSAECGENMIDHGSKCYRILSSSGQLTWYEASSRCTEEGLKLVTFPTLEERVSLINVLSMARLIDIYVGARQSQIEEPSLYRHTWRWVDGRTAFGIKIGFEMFTVKNPEFCATLQHRLQGDILLRGHLCSQNGYDRGVHFTVLCESDKPSKQPSAHVIRLNSVTIHTWNISVTQCSEGHVTRDFLSCDVQSRCGVSRDQQTCSVGLHQVPMFVCQDSQRSIHFTLVCDHVVHCTDGSDEDFCKHPPCPFTSFRCRNEQCCATHKVCDGVKDCIDSTDEDCLDLPIRNYDYPKTGKVDMDGSGNYNVERHGNSTDCPVTHFLCPFGHCLPVYLRCNNIDDCPGHEDEAGCDDYTCPGFYRCLGSKACLHPDYVCDGMWQCPLYDDEMLCDPPRCPDICHCQGLAFVCSHRFNASFYPGVRLLDASGSGITLNDLGNNTYLLHLNVSRCAIGGVIMLFLPNLRIFDLSWNRIVHIDVQDFKELKNLKLLLLANNPLSEVTNSNFSVTAELSLETIDLSYTSVREYNTSLAMFHNLKTLDLSNSKLYIISDEGFASTPFLETLDIRGCPFEKFPLDMLRELPGLKFMYASHYKLCCQSVLPNIFDPKNCHTKQDLLSSCELLLKAGLFRFTVPTFAILSTTGNIGSILYRILRDQQGNSVVTLQFFVTNLALANFLMGMYLSVIATADLVFKGDYLFHDDDWKRSFICTAAGFVVVLSNQVSVLSIFLVTLDRVLVISFSHTTVRFQRRSAMIACGLVWALGFVLALLPILPVESLYLSDATAICIPLPVSRSVRFDYSDTLTLLNFAVFSLVACKIAVIYQSLRSSHRKLTSTDRTATEVAAFRRLNTVVVSDFMCWFTMGLLAITARSGVHVPDEVNVVMAIFVLPFNSVINPFLYVYNTVAEKRRKIQEELLIRRLQADMKLRGQTQEASATENRASARTQVNVWMRNKILSGRDIASCTRSLIDGP